MKISREIPRVQPQDQEESQGVRENHCSFFYYKVETKETLDSSIHYSLLERIQVHDVST